jgi:Na+/H+-dicarboxylate symporter
MTLSHFSAVFFFAVFSSVVFGITLREDRREQVRYGLFCLAWFLGGTLIGGWLMYVLNPH